MTARSHLSTPGLLRRQFLAGPGASIALAALVLVGAFLATSVPRAVAALHTAALADQLATVPANELDLTTETRAHPDDGASTAGTTLADDVDAVWGRQEEVLTGIRDALPEPLRGVTGAPHSALVMGPVRAVVPGAAPSSPVYRVLPGFDPRLREHVELTSGDWPAPVDGALDADIPVDLVLSDAVAERMAWELGEVRFIDIGNVEQPLRLAGTVAAIDVADGVWTHVPSALEPSVIDNGLAPPEFTATAFVDPAAWTAFSAVNLPVTMQAWFPVLAERITADETPVLRAQLGEFSSDVHALGSGEWVGFVSTVGQVGFLSGLGEELGEAAAAAAAADAVLATIASGPIGVMVAVLVLGARVVFERRRLGLELAAARGASVGQLRGILGLEGLAIGVPAAVVGGLLGTLVVAADAGAGGWLLTTAFALTPAALMVASAPALSPLRRARADLGGAGRWRFRWIAELIVVLLAAAAVVLLLRRGLATSVAQTGVDPLLAAVPLLLSLVACIVVLRLYPLPLARLVRTTAARPGLVPFLGSARALRDPGAGLVPVLAVVVGISVAVFSSVLLGTVRAGVDRAAAEQVGADASISGMPLTLAQLDEFRAVPGVEAIAPVYSTRAAQLSIDGRARSTTLIVVDVAEMRAVQAGRPDATPLPESLAGGRGDGAGDGGVPVLLSGIVDDLVADADDVGLEGEPFQVQGVVEGATAYSPRANWVLMDRSNAEPFTDTLVPRTVLVRFEPGADGAAITAALAPIAGEGTTVVTPIDLADELAGRPTAQGLVTALIAAIVLASLLTALAIVLTLVVGRPARDRLLPLLSTLGLGRRGEQALVAWEVGPVAVVAVLVGAVLGAVLPFVVLQGIDLRAFTGGDAQPAVAYDPWLVTAVLVGSVLVTAVAVAAASRIGSRVDAARAMRTEEEG
ncbi:putative ABC transport system permease protein [Agromyces ramosus]|uniref:Putative ABC transport system permease protein n=1 Tax=Agromyces ramosus TaxID=33879 RepID=A0A4Q7MAC6_9MICO|nr:FtsX-like permease family protein [Agromyces ramosus]RZS64173.1 putative ABC transport system permease protein [Agromyces ramosus]